MISQKFLDKVVEKPPKWFLLILVLWVVGFVPGWYKIQKWKKHNEIQGYLLAAHLRTAQTLYFGAKGNGNYTSNTSDLEKIKSNFYHPDVYKGQAEPQFGYILSQIKVTQKTDPKGATFSAVVYPTIQFGILYAGNDCFYIDQTGVIRHSGSPTKIPDTNSPPVE